MKNLLKSNRIKSIIINAVIAAALLMCVNTVYETNDDHTIAKMIVGGYANVGFVNYYLCKVLIVIQKLIPGKNAFILAQILLSYIAFVIVLRVVFDRSNSKFINIVAVAVVTVFSIDHYAIIQFTKTSALLITAGLVLILDSSQRNRKWPNYVEGGLMVLLGTAFRWNTMLPSLAYLCAYVAILVFILLVTKKQENGLEDKLATFKKLIPCALVVIIAIGASYGLDTASSAANRSTEELRTSREYSSLRARMTDFPTEDLYEKYSEECDAIGIDANDILLIHNWVFDYDGAATIDNLKVLSKIGKEASGTRLTVAQVVKKCGNGIIKSLRKRDYTACHIVLLLLLCTLILVTTKPRNWLYILGYGVLTLGLYLVLYYMQRPVYRTLYIADIGAAIWLLYVLACNHNKSKKGNILAVILIIACLAIVPTETQRVERRYRSFVHKTRPVELDNYFEEHNDSLFVCEVNGWNNAWTYSYPLKVATSTKTNDVSVGGWSTLSPYMVSHLQKYNISNPIKDIINNDKAYYVGNARLNEMKEYYNKWYGNGQNSVKFIYIDTVGGKKIWKIVK